MAYVKFDRSSLGTVGCRVGLAPHIYVGAYGTDAVDALHRASSLAKEMDSIVKEHPELALLPGIGQAVTAMKAVNAASDLLKKGGSLDDISKAIGPSTASAISSILRSIF